MTRQQLIWHIENILVTKYYSKKGLAACASSITFKRLDPRDKLPIRKGKSIEWFRYDLGDKK